MIHCDNLAAVYSINKGSTAHPLIMLALTCRLLFWLLAVYNNYFRFTAVYVHCHFNTILSAMSCLHEPTVVAKCVAFYHYLQEMQPCQPPDSTPLTQHDLTQLQFPFFQAPRTANWHSNFKKKFISTAFTSLLRALKHCIAPTGLVISGFVSV